MNEIPENRDKTGNKNGFRGPEGAGLATRFKPGQSGNPKGRPKAPWTHHYADIAGQKLPELLRLKLFVVACDVCKQTGKAGGKKCSVCKGKGRVEFVKKGCTVARGEAMKMHLEVLAKSNVSAVREMADRVEGTPPARIQIEATDVKEIRFVVRYEDADERERLNDETKPTIELR